MYRTLSKDELEKWVKNPNISPYNNRCIRGWQLTPLTSNLRDQCIQNGILPPILPTKAKIKDTAEEYRTKVRRQKTDFVCDIIEKTLKWVKAGNEWKRDEKTLKEIGIDINSKMFASKV